MSSVVGFMVDMTVIASMSSFETVCWCVGSSGSKKSSVERLSFLFFSFSIFISSLNPSLHPSVDPSRPSIKI